MADDKLNTKDLAQARGVDCDREKSVIVVGIKRDSKAVLDNWRKAAVKAGKMPGPLKTALHHGADKVAVSHDEADEIAAWADSLGVGSPLSFAIKTTVARTQVNMPSAPTDSEPEEKPTEPPAPEPETEETSATEQPKQEPAAGLTDEDMAKCLLFRQQYGELPEANETRPLDVQGALLDFGKALKKKISDDKMRSTLDEAAVVIEFAAKLIVQTTDTAVRYVAMSSFERWKGNSGRRPSDLVAYLASGYHDIGIVDHFAVQQAMKVVKAWKEDGSLNQTDPAEAFIYLALKALTPEGIVFEADALAQSVSEPQQRSEPIGVGATVLHIPTATFGTVQDTDGENLTMETQGEVQKTLTGRLSDFQLRA